MISTESSHTNVFLFNHDWFILFIVLLSTLHWDVFVLEDVYTRHLAGFHLYTIWVIYRYMYLHLQTSDLLLILILIPLLQHVLSIYLV
jgi:hypothetical protein